MEFTVTLSISDAVKALKSLKIAYRGTKGKFQIRCRGRQATFINQDSEIMVPATHSCDFKLSCPNQLRQRLQLLLGTYPKGLFTLQAQKGRITLSPGTEKATALTLAVPEVSVAAI